ncbi:MAG TPA: 2-amino-4-hydroxy-6-hydroxymethyldihydropteridine diphosphokinase [Verrucomicrobiae bacterium]|nr:2-amino-4-hydroxy-6-hydroxymethyldihydropteridine diphosphokinase [Verrucomicrobiae bacterium]
MKVGLALGSNLGDRLQHLQQAKAYLLSLSPEGWHVASPLYETEPVGCPPNSPKFLNAVLEIEFTGAPKTLLKKTLAYEVAHGRNRNLPKNSARTIDIDILYFGEKEILEKDLVVPHPRMASRRFVLLPLSTIRPDLIIKGTGRTVRMLLRELPSGDGQVTFVRHDW